MIKEITSVSNPVIKDTAALLQKKYRLEKRAFLLEGAKCIQFAVENSFSLRSIFIDKRCIPQDECAFYERIAEEQDITLYYVNDAIIRKISDTVTPQPIVAVFDYFSYSFSDIFLKKKAFILVLDGISDPGNLGTIIRTADATGIDTVILNKNCTELFSPKTLRSAMGSVFNLPVVVQADDGEIINWLKGENFTIITSAADADKSIRDAVFPERSALIMGSEAHGINEFLTQKSDMSLSIPIYGKAESLNVAVAAAIFLYKAKLFQ